MWGIIAMMGMVIGVVCVLALFAIAAVIAV